MRPTEDIKNLIKKMEDKTSDQMDKRILDDVLQTLEQSHKTQIPIGRFIMKNPIIKLAAAAMIIIVMLIGIGHFGASSSSLVLADIVERFESVPFFNLTIYLGYETSSDAKKVEIWKSEDYHVRAHEENKVIFADFSDGQNDFVAFDRTTKESVNPMGFVMMILNDLCPEGQFSLDTIIKSVPSKEGIIPVKTEDNAASREIVIFKIQHESTPEWISIWALRDSKLPIQISFYDPRNNEHSDMFFNYSQKMDPSFFDPDAFKKQ